MSVLKTNSTGSSTAYGLVLFLVCVCCFYPPLMSPGKTLRLLNTISSWRWDLELSFLSSLCVFYLKPLTFLNLNMPSLSVVFPSSIAILLTPSLVSVAEESSWCIMELWFLEASTSTMGSVGPILALDFTFCRFSFRENEGWVSFKEEVWVGLWPMLDFVISI